MIEHLIVAHPDAGVWVGYAKNMAAQFYEELRPRIIGTKQKVVSDGSRRVYIQIRVHAPNCWIYLDIGTCPTYVSGLYWIKSFLNPTVIEDDVEKLRTFFPKDTPTTEVNTHALASQHQQLKDIRASMYSGEMRKVVQVLMGMNQEIHYQYRGKYTHGVFVSSKKGRWIIRINTTGMVAYQMNVCDGKNSPDLLGYTPLPTPEPDDPIELLTSSQMDEIFGSRGVFFYACGWAFSEDGHKLANVLVESKDLRSYSTQFEITITEDPDTGRPVSASYTIKKEGYIHGPYDTHMKFPNTANTALFSFNPYNSNTNYVACNSPIFCYYNGNSLQTWYYTRDPSNHTTSYNSFSFGGGAYCTEWEGTTVYAGTFQEVSKTAINKTGEVEYGENDNRSVQVLQRGGFIGSVINLDFSGNGFTTNYYDVHRWRYLYNNKTRDDISVLIVPLHERECAYLVKKDSTDRGSYGIEYDYSFWDFEYFQTTGGDRCPVPAGDYIWYDIGDYISPGNVTANCSTGYAMTAQFNNLDLRAERAHAGARFDVLEPTPVGGNCPNINNVFNKIAYGVNNSVATNVVVTYSLMLEGSGMTTKRITVSDADAIWWLKPIDNNNQQFAFVERDAFEPERIIYPEKINLNRGDLMKAGPMLPPYDNDLIHGSIYGFVGVP